MVTDNAANADKKNPLSIVHEGQEARIRHLRPRVDAAALTHAGTPVNATRIRAAVLVSFALGTAMNRASPTQTLAATRRSFEGARRSAW